MNTTMLGWVRTRAGLLLLLAVLLAMSGGVAAPARVVRAASVTFSVNTTVDDVDANQGNGTCATDPHGPAAGKCSLRAAIMEANAQRFQFSNANPPPLFIVNLPEGEIYTLTITGPNQNEGEAASGDLDIRTPMSIIVPGGGASKIHGAAGWNDRFF